MKVIIFFNIQVLYYYNMIQIYAVILNNFDSILVLFYAIYLCICSPTSSLHFFVLLLGKTQSIYEILLKAVVDKCDSISYSVDPTTVICDFEQAVIKAIAAVLGSHVKVQGCFYHLTQSTWRKIQDLGLATVYKSDENVKHFCGMLDSLAFLPLVEVMCSIA